MYLFLIILILIVFIVFIVFKKSNLKNVNVNVNVGIISVMYKPKNIETWLQLHRDLGISHFYIRLEDTPDLIDYLKSQPDITLEIGSSSAANQYNSIMDRQLKMANDALKLCKNDDISWLIQIDCD